VTLFGQSAGGCSIRAHLVSPKSAGLFQRAIMQSDPLSLPMLYVIECIETIFGF
jgi:para-nitrobenzyl esterase